MTPHPLRTALDALYSEYNRPDCIHPDPLEFLHRYESKADREIAGFVASVLAYGRVRQILGSVETILDGMGPSPSAFLGVCSQQQLRSTFNGFKHRFTTGEEIACLLAGLSRTIRVHGSIEGCFASGWRESHENVLPALARFVSELDGACGRRLAFLLPSPDHGSACKRLNLFLRWMVRRDRVDPGDWESVPASALIVPLDTHMHRIALRTGLTARKQANLKAAVEITEAFRSICPEDPVRYDFMLTRIGMRSTAPDGSAPAHGEIPACLFSFSANRAK